MSKIFETQFEKGSYLDRVSKAAGTPTNVEFRRTEKGIALYNDESVVTNRLDLPSPINCGTVSTICIGFKLDEVTSHSMLIGLDGTAGMYISIRDNDRLYFNINAEADYTAYTPDKEWHYLIITRNNTTADAYIDNVYLNTYTYSAGGVDEDFSFDIISNSNGYALAAGGHISKVAAYDHVFTAQERSQAYTEFLQAQPVAIEKYPSYNPFSKPSDLSSVSDLIAAYNMIPSTGGVLVDVSDNDGNGVITGPISTLDGLRFDGVDDTIPLFIEAGIAATVKTICFRIKLDTTTEEILEGGVGTNLIHAAAGTLTYDDYDTAYVNGIETDTVVADQWMNIVITSEIPVSNVTATLGRNLVV